MTPSDDSPARAQPVSSQPVSSQPVSSRAVIQRLESLQRAGVTHLSRRAPAPSSTFSSQESTDVSRSTAQASSADSPRSESPRSESPRSESSRSESTAPAAAVSAAPRKAASTTTLFDDATRAPSPTLEQRCAALDALRQRVAGCTRCSELAASRTQTVFGVGNPQARLCFLGEAPGADEDRQGEPFVGKAGKLLNDILRACGLKREEVYILNILKCRPPGNRNPTAEEAANCEEYLQEQLDIIQPEWICCLGAVAATNLLKTTVSIGKLRGKVHSYRGINVVATYHPAYLLRNPAAKKDTWADMQMLMREMGIEIPDWKNKQ
jgi:DNA polymerase